MKGKKAEEARKEIFEKYFRPGEPTPTGLAVYEGPGMEPCIRIEQCMEIIKSSGEAADEIIGEYFTTMPQNGNQSYADPAGNVFNSKADCIEAIERGFYNSLKRDAIMKDWLKRRCGWLRKPNP